VKDMQNIHTKKKNKTNNEAKQTECFNSISFLCTLFTVWISLVFYSTWYIYMYI